MLIGKLFAAETPSTKRKSEGRQRLRVQYSAGVPAIIERLLEHRVIATGNLPISNNKCEIAIRPFVVGHKGWRFFEALLHKSGERRGDVYAQRPGRYLC
ncbi:transposase [Burkholderia sp. Bp8986]|uniref:IS66 family transposase n=1 Tax=Burkholderia sp. Bp8986 TaxID=2184550 RepID=UPI000F58FD46|nr:transposase [Burkholderia sp. Bp8986]RQS43638.1 hypothetical protein DID99_35050 [Burkholderia sp. Bp8986]